MMTPSRIEPRPAGEEEYDSRGRKVRMGTPTGKPQHRAVCACGYPTSWCDDQQHAVALYQIHRAVHGPAPR